MRLCALVCVILVVGSTYVSAQTTQPTDTAWPKATEALAAQLTDGEAGGVTAMLAPNAVIQSFDGKAQDVARLLAATQNAKLIVARAYIHEPLAMAADIAAAYKAAEFVPEDVKRRMIPGDDAEMARANATATQWMAQTVSAKQGDPVGIIVLWVEPTEPAEAASTAKPAEKGAAASSKGPQSLFIVFKGEETGRGQFRISLIAFGNPLPAK